MLTAALLIANLTRVSTPLTKVVIMNDKVCAGGVREGKRRGGEERRRGERGERGEGG